MILRPVVIGKAIIESKPKAKYLGLTPDSQMIFFERIKATADKVPTGGSA